MTDEDVVAPTTARAIPLTERLLLTPEDAAILLSVGRTTVYEMIGSGEIQAVKIGKRRKIARAALEEFVDRLREQAVPTPTKVLHDATGSSAPHRRPTHCRDNCGAKQ